MTSPLDDPDVLNARVRFWMCPTPGHGNRNDDRKCKEETR